MGVQDDNLMVHCEQCGKLFKTTNQRLRNHKHQFCSVECSNEYKKKPPNCVCSVCGKPLHRKPSQIKKIKNITCSYECCYQLKKQTMMGENNHQYGLKGELNASYKTGETISSWGYRRVMQYNHPYARDGYVFEHRLIAERYLLDDQNSVVINGQRYLSLEYVVHHLDFNRLNNAIENLVVMKKEDHKNFHNSLRIAVRDSLGKFIEFIMPELSIDERIDRFFEFIKEQQCYYKMYTIPLYVTYPIVEVDELSETERGEGGIGSTGR